MAELEVRPLARRLVEPLLDLDKPVLADVVLERHGEAAQSDPDAIRQTASPFHGVSLTDKNRSGARVAYP
jgi:hypothetical protein